MDRAMGLFEGKMMRTLSREIISTRREKLAKLAQIEPKLVLTTLAHHIDEVWLREAYRRTRKDGASCTHSEAGDEEDTPYCYSDAGGQGVAASGADGAGVDL